MTRLRTASRRLDALGVPLVRGTAGAARLAALSAGEAGASLESESQSQDTAGGQTHPPH